jgi:ribosome-associated toxin RatA of RatAB toxin-antitoxin module
MAVKDLHGTARAVVAAPAETCLALLQAVDRYPIWHPAVVQAVEVLDRDADGKPIKARTRLHVSRGPIVKDFNLVMAITVQRPSTVKLTKLPSGGSEQRFDVTWHLSDNLDSGTRIELNLLAQLNVPRFVPVGGIGDALASGFVAAASETLASGVDATGR